MINKISAKIELIQSIVLQYHLLSYSIDMFVVGGTELSPWSRGLMYWASRTFLLVLCIMYQQILRLWVSETCCQFRHRPTFYM